MPARELCQYQYQQKRDDGRVVGLHREAYEKKYQDQRQQGNDRSGIANESRDLFDPEGDECDDHDALIHNYENGQ